MQSFVQPYRMEGIELLQTTFRKRAAQHSVHPTSGSRRVFKQFAWLEAGSVKVAFSHPAQPPVTQTVGRSIPI